MRDALLDDLRAACFDTETGLPLPDSHLPECCVDSVRRAADEIERLRAELAQAKALNDQWVEKAKAWAASPEGARRLAGYRELGAMAAAAEARADAALALLRDDAYAATFKTLGQYRAAVIAALGGDVRG